MNEVIISLLILGTFTGYIVGRARGYHLGYSDAQSTYSKAMDDVVRAARGTPQPPADYPVREEHNHER